MPFICRYINIFHFIMGNTSFSVSTRVDLSLKLLARRFHKDYLAIAYIISLGNDSINF